MKNLFLSVCTALLVGGLLSSFSEVDDQSSVEENFEALKGETSISRCKPKNTNFTCTDGKTYYYGEIVWENN
ncbi:hypothetical protein GVN16_14595 [Emticicia sp. CRIBPO]|uniref:hypothetical protein n=1 Tax=Emticicia sp. CRIBPO TaxID=2683258 RepID=UPI0014122AEA|nr:hypothetical protein [Emticicia sp. CRIBPO]NBA86998.1 hypothetical protein [Emticicia sp. CRIBPO]